MHASVEVSMYKICSSECVTMCLKQCNTAQLMLMISSMMHFGGKAWKPALVHQHSIMLSCYNVKSVQADHFAILLSRLLCKCLAPVHARMHDNSGQHLLLRLRCKCLAIKFACRSA